MNKLLSFEHATLRTIPIGLIGAAGIFFLTLMLEMLLGTVFYSIAHLGFKDMSVLASVVINLGLWVAKIVVVLTLARLVVRTVGAVGAVETAETAPSPLDGAETSREAQSPFSHWVRSKDVPRLLLPTLLLVIVYRLAFDSQLGLLVVQYFGIDPDLTESMDLILGAPALGVLYILVIAPIFEEIVYRGILFGGLRRKGHRPLMAAFASALLFALMHMNVAQGINAFCLGLLCAYVYQVTGNLKPAILLHVINNAYVVLGAGYMDGLLEKIPLLGRLSLTGTGIGLTVLVLYLYQRQAAALAGGRYKG